MVKGVSLDVHAGEVVGLLGPNGAGKTTIFDMMVGLCQPDRGSITLKGEVITDLPMYKRAERDRISPPGVFCLSTAISGGQYSGNSGDVGVLGSRTH